MIGGKPNRSDDRAPQSAASRGSKGASGASARGGRGRATRSLASDPTTACAAPRPVRSWPDRRSRGPQPAALRPRPRVPRLVHRSAAALTPTASTARCGPGPNAAVAAQARAVRHRLCGRVCRWVRLRTVFGWRVGGGRAAWCGAVGCCWCVRRGMAHPHHQGHHTRRTHPQDRLMCTPQLQ